MSLPPDNRDGTSPSAGLIRLVLTGAESTGKSTLAALLSSRLGWPVVPEVARRMVNRLGRELTLFDLAPLLSQFREAVAAAESEARRTGAAGIVLDTDLRLSVVYARHYLGACPAWLGAAAHSFAVDLQVLCQPDFPFDEEPGQRGTLQDQAQVQQSITAVLARSEAPVLRVGVGAADRVATVISDLRRRYPEEPWPPDNPD